MAKRLTALRAIAIACLLLSLGGCGILGKKPAEWISGTFSPDGKYYVFTYSTTFITQYSKKGNMTRQQGIISYYLQAIDCATGKDHYAKPIKLEGHSCIMAVQGDNVWLTVLGGKKSSQGPALFSLGEGQLKFDPDDLEKINPGIPVWGSYILTRVPGLHGGVAMEAGDGRNYAIDPRTGRFTQVQQVGERIECKDMDRSMVQCEDVRRIKGFGTQGSTRVTITNHETGATSADDFIEPEFVTLAKGSAGRDERPLMEYRDGVVMVSQMTTGQSSREAQVALVDKADMHTRWTVVPPQGEYWMGIYDRERFALSGNRLYVANRTHLVTIDADNGNVLQSRPFAEE